ncbi:type-F conjugative transfer system pilin assembly protein TraF [Vibrio europaeus]|uniref:Type-F conjugative transfer system pilin assembly protein TraF n=1 Tax=Vibrio europaeus TaxID=300876 RepID=A0A178J406_9VIBR|nr:type-F conjugative transfer system pilin assembly protein TraF [Vibrio europaeus]MDC5706654.1 type-F conjugative transfer system pilin assembly protein TraF [Vibrio europaeus]MDC5711813.1 type-F conjugative transfer system pilin assembly protein TraF [Vibrio europaeus]MDC5716494.1 type-F conjugative transfer system pilin assembly protein TraF [Vibrio europaeus]MDC5725793.1 type-F conjugative transfer system pilin assembly protein TraF [Vibrio europaeus]MDC5732782.1 type-F conjugative transf
MMWQRLIALLIAVFYCLPTGGHPIPPGWRFYNEPKPANPVTPKKLPAPMPANTTQTLMSATEQLAWFKKQWNEANAAATIDPKNKQKVRRFLALNRYITSQTDQIGMTFKQLLVEHPELSYTREHPTEQTARQSYLAALETKHKNTVREMARQGWGLFFVYEGHDAITQQLAPSIQSFADAYDLALLGLSEDDQFITAIRENRHNQGKIAADFTPALFLVNPNTKEIKPLAYGYISRSRLLQRFYNVATDFSQSNY